MEVTSPLDKPVIPFGNKLMGGSLLCSVYTVRLLLHILNLRY